MKKLEDIPKKQIFEVPDGYFERLPGIIQARVARPEQETVRPYFKYALQYALPVILLVVIGVLLIRPKTQATAGDLLAEVSTEELLKYIEQTDITTEQLLSAIEVDDELVSSIEEEVYLTLPLGNFTDTLFDLDSL